MSISYTESNCAAESSAPHAGSAAEHRIAALEEQVARLAARLEAVTARPVVPAAPLAAAPLAAAPLAAAPVAAARTTRDTGWDRRALLRRGGMVLAGAAGAAALPALSGTAAAATGPTVTAGGSVEELAPTSFNTTSAPGVAQLNLGPASPSTNAVVYPGGSVTKAGDLFGSNRPINGLSMLTYTHAPAENSYAPAVGTVYTDYLANMFVPVAPGKGALPAFGFTLPAANTKLDVDLSPLLAAGASLTAAFINLTVYGQGGAGYLTIWPSGLPKPYASVINWSGPNQAATVLQLIVPNASNVISVGSTSKVVVRVNVTAVLVGSPAEVAPGVALTQSGVSPSTPAQARRAAAQAAWASRA